MPQQARALPRLRLSVEGKHGRSLSASEVYPSQAARLRHIRDSRVVFRLLLFIEHDRELGRLYHHGCVGLENAVEIIVPQVVGRTSTEAHHVEKPVELLLSQQAIDSAFHRENLHIFERLYDAPGSDEGLLPTVIFGRRTERLAPLSGRGRDVGLRGLRVREVAGVLTEPAVYVVRFGHTIWGTCLDLPEEREHVIDGHLDAVVPVLLRACPFVLDLEEPLCELVVRLRRRRSRVGSSEAVTRGESRGRSQPALACAAHRFTINAKRDVRAVDDIDPVAADLLLDALVLALFHHPLDVRPVRAVRLVVNLLAELKGDPRVSPSLVKLRVDNGRPGRLDAHLGGWLARGWWSRRRVRMYACGCVCTGAGVGGAAVTNATW
mmetsp:Transcript_34300/g.90635  ORF Transcript_34300/g.90635 Transcript_34300/m.90635 type:complete len:379 (-) Transcript_34300:684-1820(-)